MASMSSVLTHRLQQVESRDLGPRDDPERVTRQAEIHAMVKQIVRKAGLGWSKREFADQVSRLVKDWEEDLFAAIEPSDLRYYFDRLNWEKSYDPFQSLRDVLENREKNAANMVS